MRFSLLVLLAVAACGGDRQQISIGPPPAKMTRGVLSGPLCSGERCKCRDANAPGDGGVGVPDDGKKRFEIRLTSAQELWFSLQGMTLYKNAERPEECFYVDLPAGVT